MKKICLEQKGHPPIWASLKEATFHTFPYWKHGEPFKLQKVGSARRVTHFVQSPSCNGRVSLLAGPKFLRGTLHAFHWTKIPVLNFGNFACPIEQYIPVVQTRLKPPHVWLLFLWAGYKRVVLGITILSNGKGHFGPTKQDNPTGQSGPPSKLVPNIPVGPNRN